MSEIAERVARAIVAHVMDEEWEIAGGFRLGQPLFRILNGDEAIFIDVTAKEVFGGFHHAFDHAFAEHIFSSVY